MKETTTRLSANIQETSDRLKRRRDHSRVVSIREKVGMSFEFFPPRDEAGMRRLHKTAARLSLLGPEFFSVTYGAGGSDRGRSTRAVAELIARPHGVVAAHLTCIGSTIEETEAAIDRFIAMGVRQFVALRGDVPRDAGSDSLPRGDLKQAHQLVSLIRRRGDFDVSVATYPEKHPESRNIGQDIDALKAKQDAGAGRAISQFFYDTDRFLKFRDEAIRAGVRIPIVPGVLPVHSFERVHAFAQKCGAVIPQWMKQLFEGLDDVPEVREMVATTVATEQCARLIENGVEHIHFYTLNRADLTGSICNILGLGGVASGGGEASDDDLKLA
jgi:methylenetetrahydrofolate reductase (NADPH)